MKETEKEFFQENNIMFNSFLEKYFYEEMKKYHSARNLEIILLPYCNLKCTYCYVNKTWDKLYTNFIPSQAKTNLKLILNWYSDNNFQCDLDLFSGELFSFDIGFEFLNIIYDHFKDKKLKPRAVTIPTNYSFIALNRTAQVESILDKFTAIGIRVFLSASFDGKYMEINRPSVNNNLKRDDDYYAECFKFNSKHDFGFHPMLYSENIKYWRSNFLWFQENFKKYNIPLESLYLLTVRDNNWDIESCKELYYFISFLFDWCQDYFNNDKDKMFNFIIKDGFNILSPSFLNERQGIGCGIQDNLHIRISDLKMFQCHRLMYPDLEIGQYDSDMVFHTKNAELGVIKCGQNDDYWPICCKCPINNICIKGCLGAQFECNRDMFIPCSTVCDHFFYLYKALIDGYYKIRMVEQILKNRPELEKTFKFLREQKYEL